MPRILDISLPLSPHTLAFPNNPEFSLEPVKRIEEGGSSNVSRIAMGTHSGTHVDPPYHFIDGARTADELDLDVLVGECYVVDLRSAQAVGPSELSSLSIPGGVSRVLIRTNNSELWGKREFPETYVAVTGEGARWLVDNGIRLVGVDFLSVEARGVPGRPTHHTLLEAGVVIVEGLDLSDVEPGVYTLVCLPLKLVGADGAPARAVLIEED